MTAAALRRAFLVVTALRWLPTGLFLPVSVLLMLDRGLGLAEVGLVAGVMGVVVLVLEVPSGGLADAVGPRVVLIAAALLAATGLVLTATATDLTGFVAGAVVTGVYRALDSGPLEAWFVDAVLAADPDRRIEDDLARAGVATYTGMAAGALLAPLSVVLPAFGGSAAATAVLGCAALEVVHLVAVVALVRVPRPHSAAPGGPPDAGTTAAAPGGDPAPSPAGHPAPRRGGIAAAAALAGRNARAMAAAMTRGARTAWRSRPLRLVLLVELGWGAGLAGVELLWQPRFTEVAVGLGDVEPVAVTGYVAAAGLGAGALLSAGLPWLLRLFRGRLALTATVLLTAQAVAVVALGLSGFVGVIAAYVGFYGLHGALNAAHAALLHRRTPSGQRATVLSLNSLVARLSLVPAGVVVGVLADVRVSWGLLLAAGLLLLATPLYLLSGEVHAPRPASVPRSVPA